MDCKRQVLSAWHESQKAYKSNKWHVSLPPRKAKKEERSLQTLLDIPYPKKIS